MWWALLWGGVAGGAVLLGALAGIYLNASARLIGVVMAFGAGVLISAMAFSLTREAFDKGGALAVTVGLALGALAFFGGDWVLDHHGGRDRKRSGGQKGAQGKAGSGGGGMALALGALLDGIPESAAIGITLLGGGSIGIPMVAAVFLSNVPEGWSASAGMRRSGKSTRYILAPWLAVTAAAAISSQLPLATSTLPEQISGQRYRDPLRAPGESRRQGRLPERRRHPALPLGSQRIRHRSEVERGQQPNISGRQPQPGLPAGFTRGPKARGPRTEPPALGPAPHQHSSQGAEFVPVTIAFGDGTRVQMMVEAIDVKGSDETQPTQLGQ